MQGSCFVFLSTDRLSQTTWQLQLNLCQNTRFFSLFLEQLKPQRQVLLVNQVTFINFTLPIKSTLLSSLTSDIMNLETFSPRNTLLNEVIPMPEKSCSSAFITSLQLVIPIPAISPTFMRNEKDNRQQLQPSHMQLPLYIVSFEQCITSLRITNFTITL